MTVSATNAVSGVASANQNNYAPKQAESVVAAAPETVSKVTEVTSAAAGGETSSEDGKGGEASRESIKKAVADINKHANGTEAVFGIHEDTNRVTIKIVDKKSKEVIKEIPAEETLDLIAKAWEMAGLLVDEKR